MIAKLLELAKWVREAKHHGQDLGLSPEEVASCAGHGMKDLVEQSSTRAIRAT
ncbi:MAG: hypothetical protein ACKV0T_27680 [Planctomycetales bacterium]